MADLNLEQRIRRLADFDIAGLGGETWNRLLDGFAGLREVVGRWEDTFTIEHLRWFGEEGNGLAQNLDQRVRTEFRASEESCRKAVFNRYARAIEPPVEARTQALLRPLIQAYSGSVVALLKDQKARLEARVAIDDIDPTSPPHQLQGHPVLLTAWSERIRSLDPETAPRRVLRQAAAAGRLVDHGEALNDNKQKLLQQRDKLEHELHGLYGGREREADQETRIDYTGRPLSEQLRLLEAAIRGERLVQELEQLDRNLTRRKLVEALGLADGGESGPLLLRLIDQLGEPTPRD